MVDALRGNTDSSLMKVMKQNAEVAALGKKFSTELISGRDATIGTNGKVDLGEHLEATQAIAETTKDIIVAEDASKSMDPKITTLARIQDKLAELAGFCSPGFIPSADSQLEHARIESDLILNMIADSLDPNIVDQDSIRNGQSVLNPDGSANTNYVTVKDQENVIKLADGTMIRDPLVPEQFANVIASMQALRQAAANGTVGTAFSEDIAPLYNAGSESLMDMRSMAIYSKEIAQDAADALTELNGTQKDRLEDMTEIDQIAASQKMQEALNKAEMLQALMINSNNFTASIISAVREMSRSF